MYIYIYIYIYRYVGAPAVVDLDGHAVRTRRGLRHIILLSSLKPRPG